jgi:polyphosphate kinase
MEEEPGLDELDDPRFIDRELSWLSFNARVLQEAASPEVPLGERLLFLSIFSSNLDEFFRVRVASIRSLLLIRKKKRKKLHLRPRALLRRITAEVTEQQERFGEIFREQILPELERRGVDLVDDRQLPDELRSAVEGYFDREVRSHLSPVTLAEEGEPPFLEDHAVCLVVALSPASGVDVGGTDPRLALVGVPSPPVPRFFTLPTRDGRTRVMFLDDVIRHNLPRLFPDDEVVGAFAVKISRDADLYLEDELGSSLREAIRKSLEKRERGMPVRFLYDLRAPRGLVIRLQELLGLAEEDLIDGGRYHNLHDLAGFPLPDDPELRYEPMPPQPHPVLKDATSILAAVAARDQLLRFPYQCYEYVIEFLEEAATDPEVEEIWISLYRVASDSAVARALIEAARRGVAVTVFVEVQARFDEQSNLEWADRMEEAGVRTLFGVRGLKVHGKIALVRRRERDRVRDYAYLATGNFNEKTARIYADHGLMTADPRLTGEVHRVFRILAGEGIEPTFEHLLVSPFHLRSRFYELIDAETAAALAGEPSGITAKMNSLQDRPMIERLYAAAQAGVPVRLLVRGICCARPGLEGVSAGIEARSIVDRFLEHSRIYWFHAGGEDKLYLSSADWMSRNLNRRVEVAFPVYDLDIRQELIDELEGQWMDNTKARILELDQKNTFVERGDAPAVRSQYATYVHVKSILGGNS